jgi:ribosomal protein S18 acetylase RimI-like enzyme
VSGGRADVLVRRVGATDGQLIRTVRLRALRADPGSFYSTYDREAAYSDQEWDDWAVGDASGDEAATLIALQGTELVGIVAAHRDADERDLFHIFSMWVAPEVRGERIGRRLLRQIEAWIASCGGVCAQLSVADTALVARHLYETAGYRPDGERSESPHSPGVAHVSLRKAL